MNVTPSSASRRASERSLIPSFLATTFACAWPWGSNGAIVFSTVMRNAPVLRLRELKVSSHTLSRILFKRGSASELRASCGTRLDHGHTLRQELATAELARKAYHRNDAEFDLVPISVARDSRVEQSKGRYAALSIL